MRIISMHVLKWDPENPIFLTSAYELGFIRYQFLKSKKNNLYFVSKSKVGINAHSSKRHQILVQEPYQPFKEEIIIFLLYSRVQKGERTAVTLDDAKAMCYVTVDQNNMAFVVVCDEEYPQKVPFVIIREIQSEFFKLFTPPQIAEVKADANLKFERLEQMIKDYQDYKKADKLAALENNIKEVTEISHKIMGDLLRKGEKLEELMAKSKDMSNVSVDFYKKAKKTNSRCCSLI